MWVRRERARSHDIHTGKCAGAPPILKPVLLPPPASPVLPPPPSPKARSALYSSSSPPTTTRDTPPMAFHTFVRGEEELPLPNFFSQPRLSELLLRGRRGGGVGAAGPEPTIRRAPIAVTPLGRATELRRRRRGGRLSWLTTRPRELTTYAVERRGPTDRPERFD